MPFQYFFQAVSIQAFVSAGLGGALGTALLSYILKIVMKKNAMLYGATLVRVNPLMRDFSPVVLYAALQQQA